MSAESSPKPASKGPDTLLIMLAVAVMAYLATWFVPKGLFNLLPVSGHGHGRAMIDPDSFHIVSGAQGGGAPVFGAGGEVGFLNLLFEGLVSGDRNGATVGLMAFLLIVGGAFGMVMHTGSIERALKGVMSRSKATHPALIAGIFILFSLGGAVFGMGEEAIVFVLILSPTMVRAGYDSVTAVLVTYVATQVGFATSWMNPFSLVIAQGIAGVPLLSGMSFRIVMWILFTALAAVWVWRYAARIKAVPQRSISYDSDRAIRDRNDPAIALQEKLKTGDVIILSLLAAAIGWIAWGVTVKGYYLAEIAGQFFAMGLVAAIVALAFRLPGVTGNGLAHAFRDGAVQMAPAVIVVAIAKGIVLILGGDAPTSPSVLNTFLNSLGSVSAMLPDWASATAMLFLQSLINLFVASGSGQAALTMPLMAPLADMTGVTRQTAVLAFQLGDGLTNIVCPASAALLGSLTAARIEWMRWIGFIWRPTLGLLVIATGFVLAAHFGGYS
ncbi:putative basic amino acid antiporter YfcC [Asticcacaulis sp. AC402]|uniref:putative basic amino acid antiporter YfcC n=1 Tax=Asticcacaulis sp. AC402 TaxID=1282361 RepID=UPI0003C3D3D0|nr:putative basic amino acid antiporter YfcC [Asticcacaulis sp. AC402]ESQ74267.1 hypothetical protein ABAC402_14975 [Asticcacaulis sp. AC402]